MLAASFAAERRPPTAKMKTTPTTSRSIGLSLAVRRDSARKSWSEDIRSDAATK
jgi:hypothetical protein